MSSSAIIERIRSLLETTPPFSELSDDERQDVLADISMEYYKPGEVIVEQSTSQHRGLYVVESGLVRLMDVEKQRLVDKCGEGDFFGSFGLLKGGVTLYQAKAVEETVCALIRVGRFQELYRENDTFQIFFDQDIRRYMRHLDSRQDVSGRHLLLSRSLHRFSFTKPLMCDLHASVRHAATLMTQHHANSVVVENKGEVVGIVSDGDLRSKVLARGKNADTPIRSAMREIHSISSEKTLFDAMLTMLRHGVRRLLVESGDSEIAGLISDRDIAHFRELDPVATEHRITRSNTISQLAGLRQSIDGLLLRLYQQGVLSEELKRIMALLHDRIATRVLEIEVANLSPSEKKVLSNTRWAWLRLGSGGRQEANLKSEQHNALVYAEPSDNRTSTDHSIEDLFNKLADNVNQSLDACGFALSSVVARDPMWRKSVKEWKKTYRTWIHLADEEALRRVPFFFDLRAIYGDKKLVQEVKEDVIDALNVQELDDERDLLAAMAELALEHKTPLSFFGSFVLERSGEHRHTFDIREHGILPIVDAARVLALDLRYVESVNTFDRLRHAKHEIPELRDVLERAQDAYNCFVDFRLEHQLQGVDAGDKIDNFIAPGVLSKLQQNLLKSAFKATTGLQKAVAERYGLRRSWNLVN